MYEHAVYEDKKFEQIKTLNKKLTEQGLQIHHFEMRDEEF